MTREFLENFKVGDQQLPKEVVDAILAENGRDVAELESVRGQLKTAEDGLKAFEGVDVQDLQGKITALQNDLKDAKDKHQTEMADMAFNHALDAAITGAHGRNAKAIRALLDVDTLKASKNQEADIKTALESLQKDNGWMFDDGGTPPPYSGGTGTGATGGYSSDATLRAAMGLPAKN